MDSLVSYMSEELRAQFEIESFRQVVNQTTESSVDIDAETRNDVNDIDIDGSGVYVTWKDLWVTVSNGRKGTKPILQGLTGFARPGQLLAIMGPSGCGKSTLLDTLAGRLSTNARKTGEILINGHQQALAYGTSAYVMQDDALITTLTVREAVHYSARLQLPSSMSDAEKAERADTTIKEMGLTNAINTRIGGSSGGDKGLSGGQKRRVSICLEMLTHPKLLFLDEPTSGLDSAASYYVISRIASLNRQDGVGRTIVASIHQPSSEVFQLFDSLCLLSSGRTVFFGPSADANEFFASNGFPCPTLQNPSDHFLKTINKDFDMGIGQDQRAVTSNEAINILTNSYKASTFHQDVLQKVSKICNKQGANYDHGLLVKSRDRVGFLTQCLILTRRSSLNMYRDKGYYWLRLAVYIVIGLGLGSVFYDTKSTYVSIQAKGSLLVFIASFLTFMAIGGFPSFVEDMKVFTRERLNGHYEIAPFVVANTVSSLPFLLLISLLPGALSYYLPGLNKGLDRFLYLVAILFTCMMIVESLMMIVASLVPTYLMGIIAGAGIQALMILGGGFFRLPNELPGPFWKYPIHYIAFHTYAYQGLFKNEFEGSRFGGPPGGAATIYGDQVLREVWQVDMSRSKWIDLGVLVGMVVVYRVMFLVIIKINEVVRPKLESLFAAAPVGQVAHVMVTEQGLEDDEF